MNKEQVYLQLFHRECIASPSIERADVQAEWAQRDEYLKWKESKADISHEEVIESAWIKTCTEGYITEVLFAQDGTLNEFKLFDRLHTTGQWELLDGMLSVSINKGDNRYQFLVVGSSLNSIYSAVEYKNDEIHSYLKLMPTRAK
ncbi:hypothetical protein KP803_14970 [Vibrio sp. ZSDE26]|uniref:Uncharacterized protein n=1 Tax=Vibrio amylolyticus TaxID=2847292 RepID=A0A9X1XP71_9VIBR|nr:hypothetical protein [Vibrio amylolyticus]